jgi:hypothetical protein
VKKEGEKVYIEEVIRFLKERPKEFIGLQIKKLLLFWSQYEIANNINYELIKGYSFLFQFPIILSFGIIAPLSLCGIILSLRRKRAFLLHVFLISFMLVMIIFHILARHRLACLPILILFAGFAIFWWCERIKKRNLATLLLSFIPLISFVFLVHSQSVASRIYPIFHSESMVIKIGDKTIIRDDSGSWPGKDSITLSSPGATIKKEFIIKEPLSRYKEIVLFFSYQGLTAGSLVFDINGKVKGAASLSSSELMNTGSINLSPSLFNQGLNSILAEAQDIKIAIPIDASYTFGRSYLLKDGKWERLGKGEFMIWLELVE